MRSSPRSIPLFAAYAAGRQSGERFGDFCIRAGFVAKTGNGADFHANVRVPERRAERHEAATLPNNSSLVRRAPVGRTARRR